MGFSQVLLFLPKKNIFARFIVDSQWTAGVSAAVDGCVRLCDPVMDLWPGHYVVHLLPDDNWDKMKPPGNSGQDEKRMKGFLLVGHLGQSCSDLLGGQRQ